MKNYLPKMVISIQKTTLYGLMVDLMLLNVMQGKISSINHGCIRSDLVWTYKSISFSTKFNDLHREVEKAIKTVDVNYVRDVISVFLSRVDSCQKS